MGVEIVETRFVTGMVICYYPASKYGFISVDRSHGEERDIYFHTSTVDGQQLQARDRVEVAYYEYGDRLRAVHVTQVRGEQCTGTGQVILFTRGGKIIPDTPGADSLEFGKGTFVSGGIKSRDRVQFLAEFSPDGTKWKAVWIEPEGCPEPDSPIASLETA